MRVRRSEDVGRLIRQRRTDLGWSQKALAERVGASRLWLLKIEQGKPGAEMGLILKTLQTLGLAVFIEDERPKGLDRLPIDLDQLIDSNRGGEE